MAWQEIASGGLLDADEIGYWEGFLAEGQKGKLEIDLRWSVPESLVNELRQRLTDAGVEGLAVYQSSPMLTIEFRKGFAWLPVIVAAVLGLIALAILVVGWRFFREIESIVPEPLKPVLGIAILALLGLAVWNYGRKTVRGGLR